MGKLAWGRMVLGFVVAPIAPALVPLLLVAPFVIRTRGVGEHFEAAWIIKLAAGLGYPIAIVLGVPLYAFLKWRRWDGVWDYLGVGAFLGFALYAAYALLAEYSSSGLGAAVTRFSNTAATQMPLAMMCGAVATLSFWLIADRIATEMGGNGMANGELGDKARGTLMNAVPLFRSRLW